MLINRFIKTSDFYRVELLHKGLPVAVKTLSVVLTIAGPIWIVAAFLADYEQTVLRAGILGGFVVLFFGRILALIAEMLESINSAFIFDLRTKELCVEQSSNRAYAFLPRSIPFSEIKMLQLKHIRTLKPSRVPWMVEIILTDGKFIPMTAFKSEPRAREILQELRSALGLPVNEIQVTEHNFKEYKQRFLSQFEAKSSTL